MGEKLQPAIQPWFTVTNAEQAIAFYKAAFGAVETYRLPEPEAGTVVKLSINGAEFWISSAPPQEHAGLPLGGNNCRMILITASPDELCKQAVRAGATEIFPVGEEHGWRLGRVADPYGLHWEIGHET